MKVALITEGSQTIGFGHITRLMSFHQAFEEKGIIPKFYVNGDDTIQSLLNGSDVEIINWLENKSSFFEKISDTNIAIVDSYLADMEFYKRLSEEVDLLVCIDDNLRIQYPKGIVINGTFDAENWKFEKRKDVTYLFGSRYMPLRKAFWDVPEKEISDTIGTVMLTFGGEDSRNMTPKVLAQLNTTYPNLKKKVVIGKAFKHIEEIEKNRSENVELIFAPDAEGMKKTMLEADIAISAGGQTLYELACVGVPTVAVQVADNQKNNIEGAMKLGVISFAGCWNDHDITCKIISKINSLNTRSEREKKCKIARGLIDRNAVRNHIQYLLT
jgi:UDP-2,4-diacetamido-2,4,6-trideoxy-beta-L-altropyranose hydrolase